jgi:hypothetical protein
MGDLRVGEVDSLLVDARSERSALFFEPLDEVEVIE